MGTANGGGNGFKVLVKASISFIGEGTTGAVSPHIVVVEGEGFGFGGADQRHEGIAPLTVNPTGAEVVAGGIGRDTAAEAVAGLDEDGVETSVAESLDGSEARDAAADDKD